MEQAMQGETTACGYDGAYNPIWPSYKPHSPTQYVSYNDSCEDDLDASDVSTWGVVGYGYDPCTHDHNEEFGNYDDGSRPSTPLYDIPYDGPAHGHDPDWGPVTRRGDNDEYPIFIGGQGTEEEPIDVSDSSDDEGGIVDPIYSSDDEDTKLVDLYPGLFNRQNQTKPQAEAADTGSEAASDSVKQVHVNEVIDRLQKVLTAPPSDLPDRMILCTEAPQTSPWSLKFTVCDKFIKTRPTPGMRVIVDALQQLKVWRGKKGRCKAISFKGSFRVANNKKNRAVAVRILHVLDTLYEEYKGCPITSEESLAPKETVLKPDNTDDGLIVQQMTAGYSGPPLRLLRNPKHGLVPYFKMNGVPPTVTDAVLSQLKESKLPYARFIVPYMIARGIKGSNTVTVDERFATGTACCGLIGLDRHAMLLYSRNGTDYYLSDPWKQTIARRNDSKQFGALNDWFLQRGCTLTFLPGKVTQGAEGACVVAALTKMLNAAKAMHEGGDVRAMATGLQGDGTEVPDYLQISANSAVLAQRFIYMEKYKK